MLFSEPTRFAITLPVNDNEPGLNIVFAFIGISTTFSKLIDNKAMDQGVVISPSQLATRGQDTETPQNAEARGNETEPQSCFGDENSWLWFPQVKARQVISSFTLWLILGEVAVFLFAILNSEERFVPRSIMRH